MIAWPLSRIGFGRLHFLILSLALLYPAIRAAGIVAARIGTKRPADSWWSTKCWASGSRWPARCRFNWLTFASAFALFRLFDIWKPPPIRQMEQLPGGAGIVLDDMMAGAYGALVLFLAGWFNHY